MFFNSTFIFNKQWVTDRWNKWHLILFGALALVLMFCEVPILLASLISLGAGVLWEIKYGIAMPWYNWDIREPEWAPHWLRVVIFNLWPSDGFSWSDLVWDAIGIGCATIIYSFVIWIF